uniref:Uncharacterized protein n=1 Tax=Kwoniella bestiolae CBS 10118 TaxID=1296100 RepID=A0A1B9FRI9_9TREE|nr:hypothetical protein I302_09060 [Kwoniella bestiolae CBS 10118]OCF21383.1 hypothetical protein I302_09060 [Kwoniella bestiolae CBS 10118]
MSIFSHRFPTESKSQAASEGREHQITLADTQTDDDPQMGYITANQAGEYDQQMRLKWNDNPQGRYRVKLTDESGQSTVRYTDNSEDYYALGNSHGDTITHAQSATDTQAREFHYLMSQVDSQPSYPYWAGITWSNGHVNYVKYVNISEEGLWDLSGPLHRFGRDNSRYWN